MLDDAMLVVAVLLLTASQVLQKLGARRLSAARGASGRLLALLSREMIAALLCIAAGAFLWLAVLYRMDVGRAFPLLSLSSVLVVTCSRLFLKEPVPLHRWLGVALICAGLALVAQT